MRSIVKGLRARPLLTAAAAALSMSASHAAIVDFYYGTNVAASLTASGGTDFSLAFTYSPGGSASFISSLCLAGGPSSGTFANTGTESASGTNNPSNSCDAGSTWEIKWPTSNKPGTNRFEVGDTSTWSITPTVANDWSYNNLHIQAFTEDGQSIKLDGCLRDECGNGTPEPSTLALLGGALLAGNLMRRRRQVAMA